MDNVRQPGAGIEPVDAGSTALARRGESRGFTLLEIILALGLVVVVMGVFVVSFSNSRDNAMLEEGASRFESMIYMAGVESARCGKSVRLAFDATSGAVSVLIEDTPVEAPQYFVPYSGCTWLDRIPSELVRVSGCRIKGMSVAQAMEQGKEVGIASEAAGPAFITFRPDGSSDSAVIELSSQSDRDGRLAVLELDGANRTVKTRLLAGTEIDDYRQGQGAP